jgi:hypothetical protein
MDTSNTHMNAYFQEMVQALHGVNTTIVLY